MRATVHYLSGIFALMHRPGVGHFAEAPGGEPRRQQNVVKEYTLVIDSFNKVIEHRRITFVLGYVMLCMAERPFGLEL